MGRNDENESELHQKNVNIDSESTYDDTDDVQISSPDTVATDGEDGVDVELTSASEIDLPIEEVSEEPEEEGAESTEALSEKKVRKKRRAARRNRRRKEKKSMGKKPWIIAGSILGVLIIAYLGAAAFFMSHFLVNTSINGKDFSGKTVADVETYLKEQVADYELTVLEQNNVSDVITGSEISLAYKDNSQVQDALEQQSQLLWI